jgi:arginyl-tRNA synthetase
MVWWVSENTELFHAHNWFISLKEWKMSSRKWNIIKLRDLLDEAIDRAKKIILEKRQDFSETELKKLSEIIWIWAIKYWYLSKSRTTNVVFDWDEFMTFEWNSGPYIQYAYVRWLKILKKSWFIDKGMEISQKQKVQGREIFEKWAYQNVSEWTINLSDEEIWSFSDVFKWDFESDEETELIKELANYKEILLKTSNEYFPHILAWYSYNLTKKFNAFYNNVRVLEEEDEDKKVLKLMLVKIFLETLKDSFGLLGIEMPEEM